MSMSPTLEACLQNKGCQYEVLHHPYSHSSIETASAAHVPGERLAKTVLLEDEQGYVAAVLPSTHAVRLSEIWEMTGRHLTLASETDMRELFKDCEPGALPPVCTEYGMMTFLDEALAQQPDVYFEAGDHEELVHMSSDQFLALMDRAERARFAHRMQGVSL
ncbi:MAG TPA: YbaK/EbsC family protein [Trinickia sp.]